MALVLQIVHHQLGCNLTDTLTWVLTVSSADGHRIAVGNHLVGLFQVQLLTVLTIQHHLCQGLGSRVNGVIHLHATYIGESLVIVVVALLHHVNQLLTSQLQFDSLVLEWVQSQGIGHGKATHRLCLVAHTTRILETQVGMTLLYVGIAHHVTQLLVALKWCVHLCQHTIEGRVLREIIHQGSYHLILVLTTANGDVFGLAIHHLTILKCQCGMGNTSQSVLVLGDKQAIVHLTTLQLGVTVSTYDDIHPRQILRHLYIALKAQVREEQHHIALLAQKLVLLQCLQRVGKLDINRIFRVTLGDTHRTQCHSTYDTHLNTAAIKHLVRLYVHVPLGIGLHIGTQRGESRHANQLSQTLLS